MTKGKGSVQKLAAQAAGRKISSRALRRKALALAKKHGSHK